MLEFLNEVLMIEDLEPDAYQMGISGKSGAKMKAPDGGKAGIKGDFNALHPRYPKGHPQGGKFMPKGSKDQIKAIAKNTGQSVEKVAAAVGGKAPAKAGTNMAGKVDDRNPATPKSIREAMKGTGTKKGEGKAPAANKGKLTKFSGSAGAVGKAQKILKNKESTPEQRAKAKASIAKAAGKMRGDAPMAGKAKATAPTGSKTQGVSPNARKIKANVMASQKARETAGGKFSREEMAAKATAKRANKGSGGEYNPKKLAGNLERLKAMQANAPKSVSPKSTGSVSAKDEAMFDIDGGKAKSSSNSPKAMKIKAKIAASERAREGGNTSSRSDMAAKAKSKRANKGSGGEYNPKKLAGNLERLKAMQANAPKPSTPKSKGKISAKDEAIFDIDGGKSRVGLKNASKREILQDSKFASYKSSEAGTTGKTRGKIVANLAKSEAARIKPTGEQASIQREKMAAKASSKRSQKGKGGTLKPQKQSKTASPKISSRELANLTGKAKAKGTSKGINLNKMKRDAKSRKDAKMFDLF